MVNQQLKSPALPKLRHAGIPFAFLRGIMGMYWAHNTFIVPLLSHSTSLIAKRLGLGTHLCAIFIPTVVPVTTVSVGPTSLV